MVTTLGRGCTGPLPGVDGACTLAGIMWTPLQGEKAPESVAVSAQSCAQLLRRGRFSGSLPPRVPPPVSTSAGCREPLHAASSSCIAKYDLNYILCSTVTRTGAWILNALGRGETPSPRHQPPTTLAPPTYFLLRSGTPEAHSAVGKGSMDVVANLFSQLSSCLPTFSVLTVLENVIRGEGSAQGRCHQGQCHRGQAVGWSLAP